MGSELRKVIEASMDGKDVENVHKETSAIERPKAEDDDKGMLGDGQEMKAEPHDGEVELGDENKQPEEKAEPREKPDIEGEKSDDQPPAEKQGDEKLDKSETKAPVGWTPENREQWGKLPASVRQQISKREQEVNKVLQESSGARKFANQFTQTIDPYKQMMINEGASTPIQAIDELLKTAATLTSGNKQQKAQRMGQLIRHYGIDISELDNVLSADPNNPTDIESIVEQRVSQRMQPYQQQEQAQRRQQQEAVQQRAAQALAGVQKAEFFNDVKLEMADIIEMASRRGQQITPVEAYQKAVRLNSSVQSVLKQRHEQGLAQKRKAATSIHGNRGGVVNGNPNASLRDELEAQWAEQSRR